MLEWIAGENCVQHTSATQSILHSGSLVFLHILSTSPFNKWRIELWHPNDGPIGSRRPISKVRHNPTCKDQIYSLTAVLEGMPSHLNLYSYFLL